MIGSIKDIRVPELSPRNLSFPTEELACCGSNSDDGLPIIPPTSAAVSCSFHVCFFVQPFPKIVFTSNHISTIGLLATFLCFFRLVNIPSFQISPSLWSSSTLEPSFSTFSLIHVPPFPVILHAPDSTSFSWTQTSRSWSYVG